MEQETLQLVGAVLALLTLATVVGQFLKRQPDIGLNRAAIATFNARVRAWWLMLAVLAAAIFLGDWSRIVTVVIFGAISFWALREFITLTPTRLADHRTLFWVFVLFTPLQYVWVATQNYELFTTFIPVFGFLFIPARIALAGDYKRYLERCAKIQAGLIICVYALSYAPAILYLPLGQDSSANARLLFFFVLVVQFNDAMQYLWSRCFGGQPIAPMISPSRTLWGLLGGAGSAALLGLLFSWAVSPFEPWQAVVLAMVSSLMGFAGGMTMSAIKRDRGVKDYGTLVTGHDGVLDRIDSLCFAAPVFYQIARLLYHLSAAAPAVGGS